MSDKFCDKLRLEIRESQKRHFDFSIRKLGFVSGLLGLGGLSKFPFGLNQNWDFTPLLFLAPIVAIAYDFYIVAEDFNIKRAGEFLSRDDSDACDSEKAYESYVQKHVNKFSPIAFFIVTMIFLAGASFLLLQDGSVRTGKRFFEEFFNMWLAAVLAIEIFLLVYSLILRRLLKKVKVNNAPNKSRS